MIKLALTDLDDTLIPNGQGGASDRAIAAIHAMFDAGLHFGPVSGRIPSAMGWMFRGDDRCCATGAFVNGQVLRVDGQDVRIVWIDAEPLRATQRILDGEDLGAFLTIYDIYDYEQAYFATGHPEWMERHPVVGLDHHVHMSRPELTEPRYIKTNILCDGSREQILALRDRLNAEVEGLDFVMPSNVAKIIDITPAGWNKGTAALALGEILGVAPEEIATFGDSENDLAMIEAVPNSVAVANASSELQAAARWHIGDTREDAVAAALEQIAAAAPSGGMPAFMK